MPEKSPATLLVRALIIFLAMTGLLVGYYWVHKPFDGFVLARVGGALIDLVTVAALFAAAGGIGRAALRRLDLTRLSRAERVALEGGIGLGIVALATLIIGLVGLFHGLLLWAALIVAAVLLRRSLLAWLRDGRDLLRGARGESGGGMIMLYSVIMLALALILALAPPTHWDSLTYHLVAPQRYLAAGAITAQPDNFYLGLSQNVEMLYSLAVGAFGRDTAAAPVHFGIGLLALLATAGVVRRCAGRSAGWLAALLLLSAYNLWALFGWAYVDLATMLYGALALVAAVTWRERRESGTDATGWIVLMGVIVGLALGVKYAAGMLGVTLWLFVLIHAPRRAVHNGLIMGVTALLVFAPWLLKGALLYDNPLYPFVFGGLNWNADRMRAFQYSAYDLVGRGQGWQVLFLPVSATIFGADNADGFGFTAGAWLLTAFLLLPLVWTFLGSGARRLARDVLILLAPLLVYWAAMTLINSVGIQTRLMLMAFPLFAAAGAVGLDGLARFPKKPLDIHFIVRAALALTLVFTALDALRTVIQSRSAAYVLGAVPLEEYMYANTQAYYNAVSKLPEESNVLLMWEPRGYWCPPSVACTADLLFDNWKLPIFSERLTPDAVFERYQAQGYDYLLYFRSLYDTYLEFSTFPEIDRRFPDALDRWMTPVWTDGVRYTLYGWRDGVAAAP